MKRQDSRNYTKGHWSDTSLCKKTFAISINGNVSHVICYYAKLDVVEGRLLSPSQLDSFKDLELPRDYIDPCNFRLHPKGSNNAVVSHGDSPYRENHSTMVQSPLSYPPMKQMEPIVRITPRPSPQPEEGYVTVHLWNGLCNEKTLCVSLSNEWLV
jgi:hypothetical protein